MNQIIKIPNIDKYTVIVESKIVTKVDEFSNDCNGCNVSERSWFKDMAIHSLP